MKKIRLVIAGVLASVIVATPMVALAEGTTAPILQRLGKVLAESTDKANNSSAASKDEAANFEKLFETEKGKQTPAQRIQSHITALKIRLTTAEAARLKLRCVAGQAKVKLLDTQVNNGITARLEAYNNVADRLDTLSAKLKAAKVDTTKLAAEQTELANKIATFQADLATYKLDLEDLQGLGCQADPTGFKAALEAARSARATVAADAAAIRAYVKDPIKVTLTEIKTTLDKSNATSQGGNQ
jgi:hypothetical protein